MKKFFLIIFLLNNVAFSQSPFLKDLRNDFFDSKTVYVRMFQEVDPRDTIKTFTQSYYFLRFDNQNFNIGNDSIFIVKVFMSNRYFVKNFSKRYANDNSILKDMDGFYYLAKVELGNANQNLEIYPSIITNICKKQMHGNLSKCNNYDTHIRNIVDFVNWGGKLENGQMKESVFKTAIKSFNIKLEKTGVVELQKDYTKFSLSDDEIKNNYYSFKKVKEKVGERFEQTIQFSFDDNGREDFAANFDVDSLSRKIEIDVYKNGNRVTEQKVDINNSKKGWIYAGKLDKTGFDFLKNTPSLVNINSPIQNQTIGSTVTDIYVRKTEPKNISGDWQKGAITDVIKEKKEFKILNKIKIPGADGYPLLWLEITF